MFLRFCFVSKVNVSCYVSEPFVCVLFLVRLCFVWQFISWFICKIFLTNVFRFMFHLMIRLVKFSVRTSFVSCFISWFVCKSCDRIVIWFRIRLIGTCLYVVTEGFWGTAWDGSFSTSVVLSFKAMAWLTFSLRCNQFPLNIHVCRFPAFWILFTTFSTVSHYQSIISIAILRDLATTVTGPKLFIEKKGNHSY